ncbi:FAD binding domain-containing protein [[Eubacterium] cellulosolvens]
MRALAPVKYYTATSIEDACNVLNQAGGKGKVLGGGSDIVDWLRKRYMPTPEILVDIKKLGLNKIEDQDGGVKIGATVKLSELVEKSPIPMLAEAARKGPSPQIQNQATVGGNICQNVWCWYYRLKPWNCYRKGGPICFVPGGRNQYHAIMEQKVCNAVVPGDLSVALTALNANVNITGTGGARTVPMKDFYIVLGNVLKPDEIITDIVVPEKPSKGVFLKSRTRGAIDFATASVALATTSQGTTVALGGVAPIIPSGTPSEINAALNNATPLSENRYKINIVKQLLKEAGA